MGAIVLGPSEASGPRANPCGVTPRSPADSELVDDGAVALGVLALEVLEKAPALADEHQETPSGVVILGVLLEVIGEAVDALGEERDLHLGRPRIAFVDAELLDQALLLVDGQWHATLLQSPRPGESASTRTGSKKCFYCRQIRSVSRGPPEVKRSPQIPSRAAATSCAIWRRGYSTPGDVGSSRRRRRNASRSRRP